MGVKSCMNCKHGDIPEFNEPCVSCDHCSNWEDPAQQWTDGREAGHEWISVEDRLPTESDGTVLVCFPDVQPYNFQEPFVNAKHDRRVRTATYSQYSKQWYIGDMCAVGEVLPTHWMPLPEPPKEEA